MEETKVSKREWVKTAAIIFLAILLVLTFFSNTIMNATLPEVAAQQIEGGTINAKIRGSGTVGANETYDVTINQTRKIASVLVKVCLLYTSTKLNTEIMSGVIPDMFLTENLPIERYAAKGILTDLYELIDSDAELTRESFVPQIIKACETDGKLYELPASFMVQTAFGLSKDVYKRQPSYWLMLYR